MLNYGCIDLSSSHLGLCGWGAHYWPCITGIGWPLLYDVVMRIGWLWWDLRTMDFLHTRLQHGNLWDYWFVTHGQHLRNDGSTVISFAYVLPTDQILCKPIEGGLSTIGRAVFPPAGWSYLLKDLGLRWIRFLLSWSFRVWPIGVLAHVVEGSSWFFISISGFNAY